jgi:hypothetical protein
MITGGLSPGEFNVPDNLRDMLSLRIMNALWPALPDMHDRFKQPMCRALRQAIPRPLFYFSECFHEAIRFVGIPS